LDSLRAALRESRDGVRNRGSDRAGFALDRRVQ
jgi:hypothetical protein